MMRPVVDSIEIRLGGDQRVTNILAHGILSEDIPTLCNDLKRCFGHTVLCTETRGNESTLVPQKPVIIDNITETYDFLTENIGDLVYDISFCQDEEAILTQNILNVLLEDLDEKTSRFKRLNETRRFALIFTGDSAERRCQAQSLKCYNSLIDKLSDEVQNIRQLIHYISEYGFSGRCEVCNEFLSFKRVITACSLVCRDCIAKA